MECSVSEKTICEPPSTLHEMLTAVAVTLILAGQAFRHAREVQEGWLRALPVHWVEPAAGVPVGRKPGAVYKSGLSFMWQRLSANLL